MDRYRRVAFLLQRTAKLAVYMMVVDIEGLVVGDMCWSSWGWLGGTVEGLMSWQYLKRSRR